MKSPSVSIIIVNYQTHSQVLRCLSSIFQCPTPPTFEVIIVDNDPNSTLSTSLPKSFPQVIHIQSPTNLGFGAANNLGASVARGQFLFFTNPDTILAPSTLHILTSFLRRHPKVGIVAPLLIDPFTHPYPLQGTAALTPLTAIVVHSFFNRWFPNNPISRRYWLTEIDRSQPFPVAVVPGSSLLISNQLFHHIGQFDPAFFLYFEESDLSRRVSENGFSLFIHPRARVTHTWEASTSKQPPAIIDRYFSTSRSYYFRKHFGPLQAALVQIALSSRLKHLIFLTLLITATAIRLFRIPELMPMIGDFGHDFLAARDAILHRQLPLLGITSSVPRFHQGPLYIWFLSFALTLGNFDPLAAATLAIILGVAAIGTTFILADRFFSTNLAIIASLILLASPLAIIHSRMAFHPNAIPLFSALYLFSLLYYLHTRRHPYLPPLLFALLFQFELVVAPLFLLLPLVLFQTRTRLTLTRLLHFATGLLLGLLPQLIYDLTHNFTHLTTFIAWIGYRLISFTGLLPEHAATSSKLATVLSTSFAYAQRFFSWNHPLPTVLILTFIPLTLIRYRSRLTPSIQLIISWILLMLASFLVLGNTSEAYFPVLFVPTSLLLAWSLLQLPRIARVLLLPVFGLLFLHNVIFTITHDYFVSTPAGQTGHHFSTYGPPLISQLQAVDFILPLSPIRLISTDPGAIHASYLDNYRYLIWYSGGHTSLTGHPVWIHHTASPTLPPDSISYSFSPITITLPLTP